MIGVVGGFSPNTKVTWENLNYPPVISTEMLKKIKVLRPPKMQNSTDCQQNLRSSPMKEKIWSFNSRLNTNKTLTVAEGMQRSSPVNLTERTCMEKHHTTLSSTIRKRTTLSRKRLDAKMMYTLIYILSSSSQITLMKFSLIMRRPNPDPSKKTGTCYQQKRSRTLKLRSLKIGLTMPKWMTQRIPNQKTGTNQNILLILMPLSLMIGMMKWTVNGNPHRSIIPNTRANGNQSKLITQNTREPGFILKSTILSTKRTQLFTLLSHSVVLDLIYGK